MGCCQQLPRVLAHGWRKVVMVLTPLVLLPLVFSAHREVRCAFVVVLMAVFWVTEAMPLAVTALFPVALFPLLGVLSTSEVCSQYLKDSNMMFLGGLVIAAAVEEVQLHRRVALLVLLGLRGNQNLVLLGGMLTTMFLSMWMSNTAATAMMLPINMATMQLLTKYGEKDATEIEEEKSVVPDEGMEIAFLLGTAYASSLGGCGSLAGTGPNIVYVGILDSMYLDAPISYATWMAFNLPPMLLSTLGTWLWLQCSFMGFKCTRSEEEQMQAKTLRIFLREDYRKLGPTSFGQWVTIVLFVLVVLVWFMHKPRFMPGWATLFSLAVKDATPAMFVVILFFAIPRNLHFIRTIWRGELDELEPVQSVLSWKMLQKKLPWDVLIMLGGSYAMSLGFQKSGLSKVVGGQLEMMRPLPPWLMVLLIILITSFSTEMVANTAVATILLPVFNNLSQALKVNPIYLTMPCAIAASYSFLLPVGTPPNAIVAAASPQRLTTKRMIKYGIVPKLLSCAILFVFINLVGGLLFDFTSFPEWAKRQVFRRREGFNGTLGGDT